MYVCVLVGGQDKDLMTTKVILNHSSTCSTGWTSAWSLLCWIQQPGMKALQQNVPLLKDMFTVFQVHLKTTVRYPPGKWTLTRCFLAVIIPPVHTDHQKIPSQCSFNVSDAGRNPQASFSRKMHLKVYLKLIWRISYPSQYPSKLLSF